jgi:hypothetical protein
VRALTLLLTLSLACLSGASALAQEGHPVKGSWLGTWGPSKIHGDDIVVVMSWDGKSITGIINPGTDNMALKNTSLNPDGWVVHLEADGKDSSGQAITYVLEGKIENLAFHNRSITGTWKSQRESGKFKISRQ